MKLSTKLILTSWMLAAAIAMSVFSPLFSVFAEAPPAGAAEQEDGPAMGSPTDASTGTPTDMMRPLMSLFSISTREEKDQTSLLENLKIDGEDAVKITFKQDNIELGSPTDINARKDLALEIKLKIPVLGDLYKAGKTDDDITADPALLDDIILPGDYAEFVLSDSFVLTGAEPEYLLIPGPNVRIAKLTFNTDTTSYPGKTVTKVRIEFDDYDDRNIFGDKDSEEDWDSVKGEFNLSLKYDGDITDVPDEGTDITILGKTVRLSKTPATLHGTIVKTGTVNSEDKTVTWTAVVSVKTSDGEDVDLDGYTFTDDLDLSGTSGGKTYRNNSGDYKENTFKAGTDSKTPDWNPATKELSYTFPASSGKTQTITFETEIPDSAYFSTSSTTYYNKANLTPPAGKTLTGVTSNEANDTYTPPKWVEKKGTYTAGETATANRLVTWTIDIDNNGQDLGTVNVSDNLPSGLSFVSAKLHTGTKSGSVITWPDIDAVGSPVINSGALTNLSFTLSDVNVPTRLVIVTKAPDITPGDPVTKVETYNNTASVSWTGTSGPGLSASSGNVGVGYDALTKSGSPETNRTVTWTLKINPKNQDALVGGAVYDLLVYGKAAAFPSSGVTFRGDDGEDVPFASPTDLLTVPRSYSQQLKEVVAASTDGTLTVKVYGVYDSGNVRIGDLLEITGLTNENVDRTVQFKSWVTDPDIFAKNNSSTTNNDYRVANTASLFNNIGKRLYNAPASVVYRTDMLRKQLVTVAPNGTRNWNTIDSTGESGFHYQDGTAVFRLVVNADSVDLATSTDLTGSQKATETVLADTLPEGWSFIDFEPGAPFRIYEGTRTGGNGGAVNVGSTPVDASGVLSSYSIDGRNATFTFAAPPSKCYVVLVKAKAGDATRVSYLKDVDSNGIPKDSATVTNNADLTTKWGDAGQSVKQSVTRNVAIKTKVLDKTGGRDTNGVAKWTVNYHPQGQDLDSARKLKIVDTLSPSMRLRTYVDPSSGDILMDLDPTSIAIYPRTMNANGSYTNESTPLALDHTMVRYEMTENGEDRLIFTLPDNKTAYQLVYYADIVGDTGDPVSNTAALHSEMAIAKRTTAQFSVNSADSSASANINGRLRIKKVDGDDTAKPLPGAEFTLTTSSGKSIRIGKSDANGLIDMRAIPPGTYVLEETAAPPTYPEPDDQTYAVKVEKTDSTTVRTSVTGVGTITPANPLVVRNYAVDAAIGSLTLSKAVTGNGGDYTGAFEFTLTFSDNANTYFYNGSDGISGGITGSGTISLAHGQSVTFAQLPAGMTYEIAETGANGHSVTVTGAAFSGGKATGTIAAGTAADITFTNNKLLPGQLKLTKKLSGNGGDKDKEFEFDVSFSDGNHYSYSGDSSGNTGSPIKLKADGSVTVTGIPAGIGYTVTETNADGYDVTVSGASFSGGEATGTITTDHTDDVTFTNTRYLPGQLKLTKKLGGNGGDTDKEFEFDVSFSDGNHYSYSGGDTGSPIKLKADGSVTVTGIPAGIGYTVTETNADGYDVTVSGASFSNGKATGTITTDHTDDITFTNTRYLPGQLKLTKKLGGNGGDKDKEFEFDVSFSDGNHYSYSGGDTGSPIKLKADGSVTVTGIPAGIGYTVTETNADGYDITVAGASFTNGKATGTITTDHTDNITFTNTRYLPGSLSLRKTLRGNGGSLTKLFDFTVHFSGNGANAAYSYTGHDGAADGFITNSGTISLAHGQSVTIGGLPQGLSYTITEADYSREGYTTESTGAAGTIVTLTESIAEFVNTRTVPEDDDDDDGNSRPSRRDAPDAPGSSAPSGPTAHLTIRPTDPDSTSGREKTIVVTFDKDGTYKYSGSKSGTITNGGTITLKPNEYIIIEDLPVGTTYRLSEREDGSPAFREAAGSMDGDQIALFTFGDDEVPRTGDDNSVTAAATGLGLSCLLLAVLLMAEARLRGHK